MPDPIWTRSYLLAEAKKLAEQSGKTLSIDHFWQVADRDLAGPALKQISDLVVRAKNYAVFDLAIAEYGVAGDPDIDASIKRKAILESNKDKLGTDESLLVFFCRTNLMFLGREVFNKLFTFSTHARICNFFVQKNPSLALDEQDDTKKRLLLFPRGGFKSTIDLIDCVQWIINFPDVRILVVTAESGLATAFIGELKNYFVVSLGATPTNFQTLFPTFTVPKKSDGPEDQFVCPCRTSGDEKKKEPTAWAASILSNLPGWHCDIMKSDDVINDKNSDTAVLIGKVKKKANMAGALVDPGGYKDFIGTPYAPNDLYTAVKIDVEDELDLKELSKPAWWLRQESIHKEERDCVDVDYELLFEFDKLGKKRLTHKFLREARRTDPQMFNSQYLLNPAGIKKIKFSLELLLKQTISREQLPAKLSYYILWDFAYAANTQNDYSVGAVIGLDEENRIYVLEILRDHYLDSELARAVATSNHQYRPRLVPVENSNGAQFLESSIRRYSEEMGVDYIPLDFFKVDRSLNAKATRIGALEPLLRDGRLFFLNEIDCLDDLYKEFKEFGSAIHDDIPDAISHVHRILPTQLSMPPGGPAEKERRQRVWKALEERRFEDMIFQQGEYAPVIPQAPIEPEPGTGNDIDDPYGIPGLPRMPR